MNLDPKTTALLVMDFQTAIVEMVPESKDALLERTASLVAAARASGTAVIHVVVGFRPGYPEINLRNPTFSMVKQSGAFGADAPQAAIHDAVTPTGNEVVVTKHRVGAFLGTDLEMVLRAGGIETMILAGIATSGVVLSTLRYAADADFRIVVAQDCCADRDAEVHRVLMEKVFPRQAEVAAAAEIVQALSA
jgi:nicotinamidase-related amidase